MVDSSDRHEMDAKARQLLVRLVKEFSPVEDFYGGVICAYCREDIDQTFEPHRHDAACPWLRAKEYLETIKPECRELLLRVYYRPDLKVWQADTDDDRHARGPTRLEALLYMAEFLDREDIDR